MPLKGVGVAYLNQPRLRKYSIGTTADSTMSTSARTPKIRLEKEPETRVPFGELISAIDCYSL